MGDFLWPLVAMYGIAVAAWLGHRWVSIRAETDALRAAFRQGVERAETLAEAALSLAKAPGEKLMELEDRVGRLEIQSDLRLS